MRVLAPPVFLLDDSALPEGYYEYTVLEAWLSRPAPSDLNVGFAIEPLTAQANDFDALTGTFQFYAGQQKAGVLVIAGDLVPEPDETALLTITTTNVPAARSSVLITILNDDLPQIGAARIEAAGLVIEFSTVPGVSYSLQTRTNLTSDPWTDTSMPVVGDGRRGSFTLPVTRTGNRYYRLIAR